MEQENSTEITHPSSDFSFQFSAEREYLKIERKIFSILKKISKKCFFSKKNVGCLIVYGNFYLNQAFLLCLIDL